MTISRLLHGGIVLATLLSVACMDATDVTLIEVDGSGFLAGQAFLDLDGSGGLTEADEPLGRVGVQVVAPPERVVAESTTDSTGAFLIDDVPVGSYQLFIASMSLGDSLQGLDLASDILVAPGDTATGLVVGATFPVLPIEEAREAPLGRQVITVGTALNSRVNFDPEGRVHFAGATEFLRALNVERASIAAGDSVRIRGRVVMDNGRPALRDVTPYVLIQQANLVTPEVVGVAAAASAGGGGLDAGLVRIRDAEITDTSTTAEGHFLFHAFVGPDTVEVLVREFLGLNTDLIRPDTVVRLDALAGLLSPIDEAPGGVRWRLLPRSGGDVVLEFREADLAVSASLDTTRASVGDTVFVEVVTTNNGPLPATGVQVRDSVPTGLALVSSAQTAGSFDVGSGVWQIGAMEVGRADTLTLRLNVVSGGTPQIQIVSESLGSTLERDPVATNNVVSATLRIESN